MRYRKFGNTDLEVSEIGFGAWAIGGGAMVGSTAIGWGDADDNESIKAIHRALDMGINFFDTADIYGLGHSETLLGNVLANDQQVIVASKVGNVARNGQFTVDYSKEHILNACEASLLRLKREKIDYYQLHSARLSHLQQGDCIDAMETLQKQGKIRYWGISLNTFDPYPESDYFMQQNCGSGFQAVLNMVNQRALPLALQAAGAGYGFIARMPLQFGLLTGKFDQEFSFSESDHRRKRVTMELVQATNSALGPAWELCNKYGISKTRLALSYILSYSEVSTVIAGIRTAAQVDLNTTGLVVLEEKDRAMIASLAQTGLLPVMELVQSLG